MTTILEKTTGLIAFVRTAEAGSFSAAGRVVGSTQSAVSKSVARLERRLGVRLIQRSTRILSLTTEGQAYYEQVAPLLRAIEDAEDVVQAATTAHGQLRVSAPQELGRMLISAWAAEFVRRHPGVHLELNISDRKVDLIRESYDIAVRMSPLRDTEMVARPLGSCRFMLVASPAYVERHGRPDTVDDLQKHACLRYLLAGRPWPYTFGDVAVVPDGPFASDDSGSLRQAALMGTGVAYLLRIAVADDLMAGRLVELLPGLPTASNTAYAVHAFGRRLPVRARLFIEFLSERMKGADT
ncbi:LysR family transcriptional regulator [Methylobacterium sp. P1-11]|uniref:LysR family transcriptional regulator n=1 Tax=Methylobacterium sp. P1-11 TaxID=2024616 RepID=UPI0011ED4CF6|nr:LysR family transcriptional regulator [Methylobacterium sp. P1-11]KAA0121909.1 LysR family transcriptional regulator [Methylobacterium sp. P1-11]